MTAEECIDRILEIVSRPIEVSDGPDFHVDGSSTTIIYPGGKDTVERLFEIGNIIKIYKEEK
jgi:hypothetical protein